MYKLLNYHFGNQLGRSMYGSGQQQTDMMMNVSFKSIHQFLHERVINIHPHIKIFHIYNSNNTYFEMLQVPRTVVVSSCSSWNGREQMRQTWCLQNRRICDARRLWYSSTKRGWHGIRQHLMSQALRTKDLLCANFYILILVLKLFLLA